MSSASAKPAVAPAAEEKPKQLRCVAQQPIFDREEKVSGDELLFRDGLENTFSGNTDEAFARTLDRSLIMGLDVLCDRRRTLTLPPR